MTALQFTVRRQIGGAPLSLPYGWLAGTATAGTDYTEPQAGVLEFAAGELEKSLPVTVQGDTLNEPDEAVRLHLAEGGDLYVDGSCQEAANVTPAVNTFPNAAAVGDRVAVTASLNSAGDSAPLQAWRRADGLTGKWVSAPVPVYSHPGALGSIERVEITGNTLFTLRNSPPSETLVFVHDWLPETNAWVQRQTIVLPAYDANIWYRLKADADTLSVATLTPDIWIYRRDAAPEATWHLETTLTLPGARPPQGGWQQVVLQGDFLLVNDTAYVPGNGAHLFPFHRTGTVWTAGAPFRTATGDNPYANIVPLHYDGAELVMLSEQELQRRRRDAGGPGAWGVTTAAALEEYNNYTDGFAHDRGDVFYIARVGDPNPVNKLQRLRAAANGGWQAAETLWQGSFPRLLRTGRGVMFFAYDTAWEFRERTSFPGTIRDDDAAIFAEPVTAAEPSETPQTTVQVPVMLSVRKNVPITVSWTLESVEALAGGDFEAASGTLTIPPGALAGEVPVTLLQDMESESPETLRLVLSSPSGGLTGSPALITVLDSTLPEGLTINGTSVTEGDSGSTPATLAVSLAEPLPVPLSLSWRWLGTAGPQDFTAPAPPLILPAGTVSASLPVAITGDLLTETPRERAFLSLPREAGRLPASGWLVSDELGGAFSQHTITSTTAMDAGDGVVAFQVEVSSPTSTQRSLRILQRNALGGYSQVHSSATGQGSLVRQSGGRTIFVSSYGVVGGVFTKQILKAERTGSSWSPATAFLTESPGARTYDTFDADGQTLVVGGNGEPVVEVRRRHFGGFNAWGLVAELPQPSPALDIYGEIVAVSGDWLAISSAWNSIRLHYRNQGGPDRWEFVQEIILSPGLSTLERLHMSRDLLAAETNLGGAVSVYALTSGDPAAPWQLERVVRPPHNAAHISFNGNLMAVNSYQSDDPDYILARNQGGPRAWGIAQVIPFAGTEPHRFPGPVAVDGLSIFAAGSGTAISRFSPADALLEITDDDPAPFITMPPTALVREMPGQGLGFTVKFTLSSSNPGGSLTFEVIPGTARPGFDYTVPSSNSVTITQGFSEGSVGVTGLNDLMPELDETFSIRLTGATGKIINGTTVVTVLDDDYDFRSAQLILNAGAAMRWQAAAAATWNAAWFEPSYDDSAWAAGVTGAGFESGAANNPPFLPHISTSLQSAMLNQRTGALLRIPFQPLPGNPRGKYSLRMRNDDGFTARVNGQEFARQFAPATLSATSTATSRMSGTWNDALYPIPSMHLSAGQPALLAVHGLNYAANDPDFLVLPEIHFTPLPSQRWLDWISSAASPAAAQFLPDDDMDADGLTNAAEFVLRLEPDQRDTLAAPLLAASLQPGGPRLLSVFLPDTLPAGARVAIEFADSLTSPWETGTMRAEADVWSGQWTPSAPVPAAAGWNTRTFTPLQGAFFRLRLSTGLD